MEKKTKQQNVDVYKHFRRNAKAYQMDSDDALLKLGLAKIVKEDNDNVI